MSHWPFIIAAYVLTGGGMAGLALVSWLRMRKAEAQAETLSKPFASSVVEKRISTSLDTNGDGLVQNP